MRNEILKKLLEWQQEFHYFNDDNRFFYGLKPSGINLEDWNYIVFGSEKWNKSGTNLQTFNRYYFVNVIAENYISDDMILTLIKKLEEISGFRLADVEMVVDYLKKDVDGNVVCEVIHLEFTKPLKRKEI